MTIRAASLQESERPRVLVVDDSPTVLAFTSRVLSEEGCEVETADNIFVSPQVMKFRPHLVLMDVHLGVSLGTIAVKALRRCGSVAKTRFVLYSSMPAEELKVAARDCDADDWFRKSSSASSLLAKVQRVLLAHPEKLLPIGL